VTVRFDETVALNRVSFELRAGETRVIYGAAGAGKTTLLKVAVGLIKPDSGRAYLFGQDIAKLKERDLFDLRARVGILFQEGALFDSLTIADNVSYPLLNQRSLKVKSSNGAAQRSVEDRVFEALKFVELEKTLEKFPSELSGGMRRRVGIARAVVTEPALELYDSPTAGLDPITANTIIALIIKERDLRNAGTIMVTHRYQDGQLMANFRYNPDSGQIERAGGGGAARTTKFFVMKEGRLVFEGSEDEFKSSTDAYVKNFLRPTGG
jgi:phospholipid/cholesterol/gamma-HCH transport system ATP-binding protein